MIDVETRRTPRVAARDSATTLRVRQRRPRVGRMKVIAGHL